MIKSAPLSLSNIFLPDGIEFVGGDTSVEDDCRNAVEFAVETHGALDVLVNNAAIQPKASYVPMHEFPADLWERMVGVNFTGYSLLAKHTLLSYAACITPRT